MYEGLSPLRNHFAFIFSVLTSLAKKMWDKLKLIYEGTSEVKETKANILVHEYEMFKMSPVESICNDPLHTGTIIPIPIGKKGVVTVGHVPNTGQ
ncbi:hypothetical protein Taro_031913 [Colocasia esculenta]|uniref:Uncharacterized protein n=1 Tax=Colocasia esculenta TaxID=4460 RepID=A0A843VK06_COLES|nr:hypothetical protein [Colocasia esculenta]